MKYSVLFSVLACALLCSVAGATVPILTFADPGTTSFTFTADPLNPPYGGYLTGFNNDVVAQVLNGPLAGNVYNHAKFTLTDTSGVGPLDVDLLAPQYYPDSLQLEAGILNVYDSTMTLLLRADFSFATLTPISVGTTDLELALVSFSGPAAVGFTDPHAFSFTLVAMNPWDAWDQENLPDWTANASFTSSAQPIPEPGTLIAMFTGIAITAGMIRKRIAR
jgi:hypothetical protein